MTALTHPWILSLIWALSAAGMGWYCSFVAQQITYVTLADGRRQARQIPVLFRLFLPFTPNITPLFQRKLFSAARERIERRVTSAGFEDLLTSVEFLALRVILAVVMGLIWGMFLWLAAQGAKESFIDNQKGLLMLIGPAWFFLYPNLWLNRVLEERHRKIRRSLPFVLDILTLSVEAGMDFMTALQRHVERAKVDPLAEELIRVIREIQLGKTRRESLRDMSIRVDLPDLRAVVNALVQADELGVSIGSILRIQADQIRQRRFERAEKLANEAPVKMLGPLLFCIFPAVFLILLGPVIYRMVQQMV